MRGRFCNYGCALLHSAPRRDTCKARSRDPESQPGSPGTREVSGSRSRFLIQILLRGSARLLYLHGPVESIGLSDSRAIRV